ncbi:MAG: DUF721 domain-containing protein [Methylococcaceae bacterium]|nr:DUF721 domain-containing protein [Methylococcaceae bacterium]
MAVKLAQAFQNRTLAGFHNRLDQQKQILQSVRNALPHPLSNHILHCVVNEKKLLLYTDAAAWASQLRFLKQEILQAANKAQNYPLEKLQVRIMTDLPEERTKTGEKANLPSPERIAMIKNQLDDIRDSQLQLALQRLSATLARLADE